MRHVNTSQFLPDNLWLEKAQQKTEELEALPAEERGAFIEKNSSIWKVMKDALERLSYRKCWFSEARDTVSYLEVEHFRPKKKARDLAEGFDREGYWWMSFDWKNFRIAGGIPNRKKACYFPVREGTSSATSANRNILDEQPLFLDPTKLADVRLVTFGPDGKMYPKPQVTAWENLRVEMTAEFFGLNNYPNLYEERQRVWQKCQKLIEEIFALLKENNDCGGSVAAQQGVEDRLRQLREMVIESAPFSVVARCCIMGAAPHLAEALL